MDKQTHLTESEPVGVEPIAEEQLRRDYPWRFFGAQVCKDSTTFRIFLPEATEVKLLRDGNGWGELYEPLTRSDDGVWSITIAENLTGISYKYHIRNDRNYLPQPYDEARLDPYSFQVLSELGKAGGQIYNSVVVDHDSFQWTHKDPPCSHTPMSIYELHLGAFLEDSYLNIAKKIIDHVGYLGFTHVQIMPPFQTPIHSSWGYLVGTPYAIYNRHGTLEDFKWMVNHLHEYGIGVIVDVPLGFSIQDWSCGIACIDGSDLYHHAGPEGWNDQWHTRIYNQSNPYVQDYLTGICAYAHHELGIDGVRIDAVASQIFKDYDRGLKAWERNDRNNISQGDWDLINSLGGDCNFEDRGYWLSEALDFPVLRFFQEFHLRLQKVAPKLFTIAEESRRIFSHLATPVERGGLGFTYAQNMGEMHRVRKYLHRSTEERRIEEIESILLGHQEEVLINAMNTHDECANGRMRLITELGNHIQLIGLAALCWFRPGAPMIFMGDEFCEEGWFDVDHYLDWGKTGPNAALHQQQTTNNFHDLNDILKIEPALARQETWNLDRNGSNNEDKWFSFIRWGGDAQWDSNSHDDHLNDIIFVRSENHGFISRAAEVYVPVMGEYQVIYNSIDERYIGRFPYNRHDPYWRIHSDGQFLNIRLAPHQNLALKLVSY